MTELHAVDRRDMAIESIERIALSHLAQVLAMAIEHLEAAAMLLQHDNGISTPQAERYGRELAELLLCDLASDPRFGEEDGRFLPFVPPEDEIDGAKTVTSVGCRRAIERLRGLRIDGHSFFSRETSDE